MRTSLTLIVLVLALVLPTASGAATAVIDAEYTLNAGDAVTYETGTVPGGVNPLYFDQGGGVGGDEACTKDLDSYCEHVLVELVNPVTDDGDPLTDATLRRNLTVDLTTPAADYDLFVYTSDADGTIGAELGRSTQFPAGDTSERVFTSVTTSETEPSKYALVRIVFFAPATPVTVDIAF